MPLKKGRFIVGAVGVCISLVLLFFSIICPFTFTSIPRSILPADLQNEENEVDVVDYQATGKYVFLGHKPLFVTLAKLKNQSRVLSVLNPGTLSFYQRLIAWEKGRKAHILYPISDLRGETTKLIMMALCVLIDSGQFSYTLQNSLEKQILEAPDGSWGEFELSAISILYLTKRFSLPALSNVVISLENPDQLVTFAALLQNMPNLRNDFLKLIQLFPSDYLDRFFRYVVKWKKQGIDDLLILDKQYTKEAMCFLVDEDMLLGREWPFFISPHSFLVKYTNELFLRGGELVATIRYTVLFFGLFLLLTSLHFMLLPLRLSLSVLFVAIALFATLSMYLIVEKRGDFKAQLPSLIMAPKMSSEMLFSKSKAIKGDLTMNILPIVFTMIFFVVQMMLFLLGKRQIYKIQKASGSAATKLKLIENEDQLFDMGLYVGLTGTILSFILLALEWAMVGLISAYTSTLFGIIEVILLKLLYVRPYKRKLILQVSSKQKE